MPPSWAVIARAAGLVLCLAGPSDAQTEIFGDWERNCAPDEPCTFTQANADAETNDVRMRTEISLVAPGQILMSVVVPDSVLLTEGPWLTVDGIYVGELNYVRCPAGCLARILFTEAQFNLVANGTRAVITVTSNGQRVGLVISLDGLLEGLTSLDRE